jgi:hypothetical protein
MNLILRNIYGLLVMLLLTGITTAAEAASLYVDPGTATLNSGDAITMAVRLDTDEAKGECVNTIDAVITYPSNIEPVDVSLGNSILRVWVEEPQINKADRTITFAGGIPNGYCGRVIGDPRLTNVLVEIVFRSPGFVIGVEDIVDTNIATIDFADTTTVYLNDGLGTKAPLTTYSATITLNDRPGSSLKNEWREKVAADEILPEEFSIELVRDEQGKYFNGKYYIIFQTVDKQTGIDRYEVIEEPRQNIGAFTWGRADAPWVTARSPYVLQDQSLNSVIRVKAVDKAGNEYIATLLPDESLRTSSGIRFYDYLLIVSLGILVAVVIFIAVVMLRRRLLAKRKDVGNKSEQPIDASAAADDNNDSELYEGEAEDYESDEGDEEFYDNADHNK